MQHLITISLAGIAAANNLKAIQANLDSAMQLSQTYGDMYSDAFKALMNPEPEPKVECDHFKHEFEENGEPGVTIGWSCEDGSSCMGQNGKSFQPLAGLGMGGMFPSTDTCDFYCDVNGDCEY